MNDRQLEQELSDLFSSPSEEKHFDVLAAKVWKRNRRSGSYLNYVVLAAALLGCGLSYLLIRGHVPAMTARLNIDLQSGGQLLVAAGILATLCACFCLSTLASE